MEDSNNTAKLIGALLAGAAIGVMAGILLAPDKGSETRKKMMDGAGGLGDMLKDILNRATGDTTEPTEEKA